MDYQMIQLLLEKIDKKHFASILKRSYANNKSFRVPGFAKIQNVPPPILWNQIKTRPLFTKELLFSTFLEFAPMQSLEEEDPLNRIMEQITETNQLGIIALLLMKDDEESNREAAQLLANWEMSPEKPELPALPLLPEATELPLLPLIDSDALAREKEKTKKLKLKYNELKKERDDLRALLKDLQKEESSKQEQMATVQRELEEAKQTIETQSQSLAEQETLISVLRREVSMLKSNEKIEKQQPKTIDAVVLALGCDGRLEKYRNRLQIEFELPAETEEEKQPLETVLTRYNEIWVSPLASFSIRRQLQKCKPDPAHRIYFFRSFAELLMHVNKLCNSK